jgi:hypothetical protein
MPFTFNQLLIEAGLDPKHVRLLRHQTPLADKRSLLDVWRRERVLFEDYQSLQFTAKRASFARPYWVAFFGTWDGRTLFAGIYQVGEPTALTETVEVLLTKTVDPPDIVDRYPTALSGYLAEYSERLYVEWGGGSSGKRSWSQRAEAQNKVVTELHIGAAEEPFPGYMDFAAPLSAISEAPPTWVQRLSEAKAVYLLACPRTGELYVGSASGAGGFWSRWQDYRRTGHGGNAALISREPTDWRVSILQVAGSTDTLDDVLRAEQLWKAKLQTGHFGLTRN